GVISDEETSSEVSDYVRSDFDVRFIRNHPPELGRMIQKFIGSIQGLKTETKTQLLDCFQKGLQQ
ncbi:MAG: hypothetical protein K2X47_05195, partial [Bdellovibrionales bacterium]|nr:hypothetical protein [Bdellovibrionales bacterium]